MPKRLSEAQAAELKAREDQRKRSEDEEELVKARRELGLLQNDTVEQTTSVAGLIGSPERALVRHEARPTTSPLSSLSRAVSELSVPDAKLYEVWQSSSKGMSAYAIADIPIGTRILSEPPVFSVPEPHRADRILTEFNKLSGASKAAFLALSCDTQPDRKHFRRYDTSCIATDEGWSGIFTETARFNHSCVPNAHYAWNADISCVTVHVTANITKHTEITISYRTSLCNGAGRAEKLAPQWHFDCDCAACPKGVAFASESDKRRKRTDSINTKLVKIENSEEDVREMRGPAYLALLGESIDLLQQEGSLHPLLSEAYHRVAKWYAEAYKESAGSRGKSDGYASYCADMALGNARTSLGLDLICNGRDSPLVQETLDYIRELKEE